MSQEVRQTWIRAHERMIDQFSQLLIPLRAARTLRSLMKAHKVERAIRRHERILEELMEEERSAENGTVDSAL